MCSAQSDLFFRLLLKNTVSGSFITKKEHAGGNISLLAFYRFVGVGQNQYDIWGPPCVPHIALRRNHTGTLKYLPSKWALATKRNLQLPWCAI